MIHGENIIDFIARHIAVSLVALGLIVFGMSLTLDELAAPLARMLVSVGRHGPWPAYLAPFCSSLVLFAGVRLIAGPLYLTIGKMLTEKRFWHAVWMSVLLGVLDGILLFLVTRAASEAGPSWSAQRAWLIGAGWGAFARFGVAVTFVVAASATTLIGFGVVRPWFSGRYGEAIAPLIRDMTDCVRLCDLFVYLPVIVVLMIVHRASIVVLTIVLALLGVKVLAALVFWVITLWRVHRPGGA